MQPNQTPNPQPSLPSTPPIDPSQPAVTPSTNPAPETSSTQSIPAPQPTVPNILPETNPAQLPISTPPPVSNPSTSPDPMINTVSSQAPAPLPTPVPAPNAPSFQTVASTPSPATYSTPTPAVAATVPMGVNTAFGASGNEANMLSNGKTKIGLIIGLIIGLAIIVAIGLMAWLNWDHLAIMFDPKFAYYTIDNGDLGKYEIKYYKGATIKKGSDLEYLKSLNSSDSLIVDKLKNANWLYLKPSDSSKAPLILLISKSSSSSDIDCESPDESDIVVSTIDASKNTVCYDMSPNNLADKNSVGMISASMHFAQQNSSGDVFITNDVDNVEGANNIMSKARNSGSMSETQQVVDDFYNKFDITSRKEDIKTILGSVRIISDPKK